MVCGTRLVGQLCFCLREMDHPSMGGRLRRSARLTGHKGGPFLGEKRGFWLFARLPVCPFAHGDGWK